jgi:drug/metabolite transporter (DMT)-like permease
MPAVFVLIWSTGFIVARYGMPHAPPLGFLSVRYALSAVCLGLWVVASRAPLPSGRRAWWHLAFTGVLMQAGYLGGVWAAVKHGMPAGTIALIVGLQPVLTAVWVSGRGSGQVSPRQWLGLVLGFAGLALVVGRQLDGGRLHALNLSLAVLALASITVGTLYQKHFVGPTDVRSAGLLQMVAALAVTSPLALLESGAMDWHPEMVGALVWSVLGLTLGGSSLLFLLIQRGAATEVTSLLYLVPPCVAVEAWLLFGETLTPAMLAGLAMAAVGVALVVRPAAAPVTPAAG